MMDWLFPPRALYLNSSLAQWTGEALGRGNPPDPVSCSCAKETLKFGSDDDNMTLALTTSGFRYAFEALP